MAGAIRFLGLAFAGADLVFELDNRGMVVFAAGAAQRLVGRPDHALTGSPWTALFHADEGPLLEALLTGVRPGERMGPVGVSLASARDRQGPRRRAALSVCRLPQMGEGLSCALSLAVGAAAEAATGPDGLLARTSFESVAERLMEEARQGGLALALDLIQIEGLEAHIAAMAPGEAEAARQNLAAVLRVDSVQGESASALSAEQFAVLRSADASRDRLVERVQAAVGDKLVPVAARMPLAAATTQTARALRYALDRFIEDGPAQAELSFQSAVRRTVQEADRFKAMLVSRAFNLAYQPVVRLADESLHHFEALSRFEAERSPAETIKLAEQLDMILEFDLAVAEKAAAALRTADVRIAVNISALSLMSAGFLDTFDRIGSGEPDTRARLLIEVTETFGLTDLARANTVIAALRKRGHPVCIDDFGAGAASLEYLRGLDVDFVKIDGRYIREAEAGSREALILKRLVQMCCDLKVRTVAEMVETPATTRLLKDLGVDLAQGWAFGKPTTEPKWAAPKPEKQRARRMGAVDDWR
jgi:EAL domain-containing protein (putative c-di-GMP-specific phosphodiesterase class I)